MLYANKFKFGFLLFLLFAFSYNNFTEIKFKWNNDFRILFLSCMFLLKDIQRGRFSYFFFFCYQDTDM